MGLTLDRSVHDAIGKAVGYSTLKLPLIENYVENDKYLFHDVYNESKNIFQFFKRFEVVKVVQNSSKI